MLTSALTKNGHWAVTLSTYLHLNEIEGSAFRCNLELSKHFLLRKHISIYININSTYFDHMDGEIGH